MRRRWTIIVIGLGLACLVASPCFYYAQAEQAAQGEARRILVLVSVGDDLDATIALLRRHGFRVSDKMKLTQAGDYWHARVPLRKKIPAPATFQYVTGIPVPFDDPTMWVVITADLDGSITAVEVQ